ncbi:unnamed protein product, partial [Rotaria sordida]
DHRSIIGKLTNYFITNQFFNLIRVTSYLLIYPAYYLLYGNVGDELSELDGKKKNNH